MSKKRWMSVVLPVALLSVLMWGCDKNAKHQESEVIVPTDYVDPWIGTGGHGHVFLGASVPWGMVQLGPTSITTGWDWCSGYHVSDSTVIGFSHTHLSGTGIGDLLDITVMPVVGEVTYARGNHEDLNSGLWSYSRRSVEHVEPGYYATHLERYGIDVELTTTNRIGYHKYTYPADAEERAIVFDLENGGNWDKATESYITMVSDSKIEGYRFSTGWAKDQKIYFAVELSQPMSQLTVIADGKPIEREGKGEIVYGRIDLAPSDGREVMMKVALSPTSIEGAWKNMSAEDQGWSFDEVRAAANSLWNEELGKIKIGSSQPDVMKIFYTGLYHTMFAPYTFSDVDGRYYGADQQVHEGKGFNNLTVFSLWDTYRASQPLMTLIHPEMMDDVVGSMMAIYNEQGELPVWHLTGNETYTMVGAPGIPVLADAILKGYVTDKEAAYQALKASAMKPARGNDYRIEYGYIPYDKMQESVAYDLEYDLADWSVAQVAKALGYEDDYTYFFERSKSYHKHFDPETGFMRGIDLQSRFNPDFNPMASTHRNDDYCEGNAWQYTFLVPHDIPGLVECFGGEAQFITKLDSLFLLPSEVEGYDISPDISGLIGQFAHGNEPSHHILYIYSVLGQQAKAAPLLRQVMTELYHADYDGLSGNEDAGQMSAWYILSALGFYQVEPAGGRFYFGSPMIDSAELKVRDGLFEIEVLDNSKDNIYIQNITLNGTPLTERYIIFEQIAKGGQLVIEMGSTPHNW
ncbi:MAG: GH92 family glycosyl hydrolase [Porphyromonas sp.]|nr:GH92 family glycosyl hydrolase [Porphyromonas sp.]